MSTTEDDRSGPDAAFERELLHSIPGIRPYSRKLTRDRHAAEDLVQDTLLRALERHSQWQRGTNLAAWLRTIMRNRYLEGRRKPAPLCAGDLSDDAFIPSPQQEADQPLYLELQETGKAVDKLAARFREVIEMAALDGASYEDMAATLKVPVGTVRSRLFRARHALRSDLEGRRRRRGRPPAASPPLM